MEGKMPEPLKRSHIKRQAAQARAYSQAVITEGGRTIWLAGQVAIEEFALDRLDPVAAFLEIDGERIAAVPLWQLAFMMRSGPASASRGSASFRLSPIPGRMRT